MSSRDGTSEQCDQTTRPAVTDLDIYARVVAALSLRSSDLWHQLSSLIVDQLLGYAQPLTPGVLRVVLPAGEFYGGYYCSAHGDDVYFGDESQRCLAVFRDDALLRRIGTGELHARGSAVIGDAVFVAHYFEDCVSVYPRVGGARMRCFGSYGSGPGELEHPEGLVACGGRVYVANGRRISVFTEDGAFSGQTRYGDVNIPYGVATDGHQVFVTDGGGVRVFRADSLSLERLIGRARGAWGVCVHDGALFLADYAACRVTVFDVATGDIAASLGGFEGKGERPHGVAVRADGTLFVTTTTPAQGWRLYAAPLL